MKSSTACTVCGAADFETAYSGPEGVRMKRTGECFTCAFWGNRADRGEAIVIDGHVYGIGDEPSVARRREPLMLGIGGRRFDIEFTAGPLLGKRCTTHNLWSGGEIPERWRDRLPDTAKFISGSKHKVPSHQTGVSATTCWDSAPENRGSYPTYAEISKAS